MKKVLILLFVLLLQKSYSQKKISAEVLFGYGFNDKLTLLNEEVEDNISSTFLLNINYRFKVFKEFFIETGIGTQLYLSSGNVKISNFKSTTLRLRIPILIGYTLFKRANISSGVAVANNQEFNNLDFRADYNLRISFLLKGRYAIKDNLDIIYLLQKNLSDIPDLYLMNQPDLDVSLGISYKIF